MADDERTTTIVLSALSDKTKRKQKHEEWVQQ